jgi:hypothetical protein
VSQQLFQFDHAFCREGFERRVGVFREGVVEVVAPAAGLEAHAGELGDEGVVAGGSWWVSWSRSRRVYCVYVDMWICDGRHSQHARDHLLVLVACGGVVEGAGEGYGLWVFLLGGHVSGNLV